MPSTAKFKIIECTLKAGGKLDHLRGEGGSWVGGDGSSPPSHIEPWMLKMQYTRACNLATSRIVLALRDPRSNHEIHEIIVPWNSEPYSTSK